MAFSIKALKTLKQSGFRSTLIEAIKRDNPSLADLNFDDFEFSLYKSSFTGSIVDYKVNKKEEGYTEGMVVKPTINMTIKNNADIKRNYTERSHKLVFTVNGPDADEFIKKHIRVENLSELTWDDYDTVLAELKKFTGSSRGIDPIVIKEETVNPNSKNIHLCFNSSHMKGTPLEDIPCALLSYKHVRSEMDKNLKRVLSFQFTRADAENKRDLVINNNTLNISETGFTENFAPRTEDDNQL